MGEVPLYHRGVGVFLWARYPCIQAVDIVRTRAANRLERKRQAELRIALLVRQSRLYKTVTARC